MSTGNLVALDNHALRTLRYVRESMESAGSLTVPGTAGFLMGAVGVAASALAQLPALKQQRLAVWIVGAFLALLLGVGSIVRRIRAGRRTLHVGPARRFLLSLCPALLAGVVLTQLLLRHGLEQYVAGAWLLLYGCAILSASSTTSRAVLKQLVTMGALFMSLGAATFELPPAWHDVVLGLSFGGLHLLFGALIAQANHVE